MNEHQDNDSLDRRNFDLCECGDFRRDHSNHVGRCKMPDDINHGYKPCEKFVYSRRSTDDEFEKQLAIIKVCDGITPEPPEHVDPTSFTERSFAVVENQGHSIRLINRENPKAAISIPWADLAPLRELITLALSDGPKDDLK